MKKTAKTAVFSTIATIAIGAFAASSIQLSAKEEAKATDYDRALAAGYKAQFICSGLWNGGKTLAHIKADELTGIYPRIAKIVPMLEAEIDQDGKWVRVSFDDEMQPRIALWTSSNGCISFPIGYSAPTPKQSKNAFVRPNIDTQPWPMGDKDALAKKSRKYKRVRAIAKSAFDGKTFGKGSKTSAVVVMHNGKIIAEDYKDGHNMHTGQRTWSVAKSIAGTLIGASAATKSVKIYEPALVPEWQSYLDPRRSITLDQLMRMGSGLSSDTAGNRTDPIYMGAATVAQRATGWPLLHPSDSRFRYANNDTLLAVHATRSADKKFDPTGFFQKLGMTRTFAERDWAGNYILSSQVWTTARDMTRLGLLYLNNGMWEGKPLLPADWRAYVSTPAGPQPKGKFGYGATFWLMNNSDGIPKDTIAAFGNRGQYLVIIPSRDLVIVRRGYDTRSTRFNLEEFTREIVKAIPSK